VLYAFRSLRCVPLAVPAYVGGGGAGAHGLAGDAPEGVHVRRQVELQPRPLQRRRRLNGNARADIAQRHNAECGAQADNEHSGTLLEYYDR